MSKYNLKRCTLSNRKAVTFVCSCISKKIIQNSFSVSNNIIHPNGDVIPTKKHRKKTFFKILNLNKNYKRKIKRANNDSCYFRLVFKFDQKSNFFHLHKNSKSSETSRKNLHFPLDSIQKLCYNSKTACIRLTSARRTLYSEFFRKGRCQILCTQ